MAKKEANFDLYIHDLLVEAGIQADTQGSNIVPINEALKTASKHQTGKAGFPEYTAVVGDFVLVMEDKADRANLCLKEADGTISMTVQATTDYAVNGALHYAQHILQKTTYKKVFAFADVEKFRGILIPEELKNFVAEHNAATPSRHHFMVGATERVFGAVLSFEKNETEADTVYPALEAVEDKNLLPFAIDPFGNYICYQLNEKQIVYWDHENDAVTTTGKSLKEFIESLY